MSTDEPNNADEGQSRAGEAGADLTAGLGAWVCPWGLCGHDDAQKCRAMKGRPRHIGCGDAFPPGTTLEQAKRMIAPNKQ